MTPVKFSALVLRNDSGRPRRLSATGYVEWVLGDMRFKTAPHINTDIAADNGALYARNPYSNDFGDWVGFFDVDESDRALRTITCDRTEFIGRNGSLRRPAALRRVRLAGRVGAGLDPCAAIQVPFELAPGRRARSSFASAWAAAPTKPASWCSAFAACLPAREALEAVHAHWKSTLGAVQVNTPDTALNLLANGWLMYQTLACRMWARSGYYQSGGAYGFRDQLQDAMALVHSSPACCASTCCSARAGSSWRATCSTGGTRRRAVACARTSPTTTFGCRWRCAATCTPRDDTGVLTEACRSSRGRRCRRPTTRTTICRSARCIPQACTSMRCAPSCTGCASARTACR